MSEFIPPLVLELKGRAGQLLTTLKGVQKEVAKTEKATDQATSGVEHNMRTWQTVGKYATVGVAGAAIAIGGYSVKMAADFQRASLRLVTDAGESQKNLKMVSAGMLDLSTQTGTSAAEIAKGMYLVESAGYHGAAGLTVMKAAAEAAKIGGADLATVSDALTTAMTDYNFPTKKAADVTSQLIATVGQGKTTMEALAGSLHNVLPTSSSLGISFAQITGAMATMTAEGVSADQASQNLNHAILSLANPTQVQTKEMAAMGLSSTEVAQNLGKKGLTGTLDTLVTAITSHMGPAGTVLLDTFSHSKLAAQSAATEYKGLGKEAQHLATQYMNGSITLKDWTAGTKAMSPVQANLAKQWASSYQASQAFNTSLSSNQGAAQTFTAALSKMTGGQQGLSVALHLTGDHMGAFANNVSVIGKASSEAGGHVRGWKDTQQLLNTQMDQLRATLNKVAIQLGTALIPMVSAAVKGMSGFVQFLEKNKPAAEGLAIVIGVILAGAIGAYVAHLTVAAVQSVVQFAKMIAAGVGWVIEQAMNVETAIVLWTGYFVKWIARQATSIAESLALWAMYARDWVMKQAKAFADSAASGAKWVADHAKMLAQAAADSARWVAKQGKTIAEAIALQVKLRMMMLQEQGGISGILSKGSKAFVRWAADLGKAFLSAIAKGAQWVAATSVQLAKAAVQWVVSTAKTVASLAVQSAAMIAQKAVLIGSAVAMGVVTAAQWAWNMAMDANPIGLIILAIAGLIAIIVVVVTHWREVTAFLTSAWQNVGNFFKTVGTAIANWWTGFWNGIVNFATSIFLGWYNFQLSIMKNVLNFFISIGSAIANWWNGFWNGVVNFAVSAFTGYVSWIQGVLGIIFSFFQSVGSNISNAWNNLWSGMGSVVQNAFNGVVGFIRGAINSVIDVINGAIGGINGMIGAVNAIPGVHVGTIGTLPHLATGGTMMQSGFALVGEQGPEVVRLPAGATVYPNGTVPKEMAASSSTAAQADSGSQKVVTINVAAQTNASPYQIASSVGWELRRLG